MSAPAKKSPAETMAMPPPQAKAGKVVPAAAAAAAVAMKDVGEDEEDDEEEEEDDDENVPSSNVAAAAAAAPVIVKPAVAPAVVPKVVDVPPAVVAPVDGDGDVKMDVSDAGAAAAAAAASSSSGKKESSEVEDEHAAKRHKADEGGSDSSVANADASRARIAAAAAANAGEAGMSKNKTLYSLNFDEKDPRNPLKNEIKLCFDNYQGDEGIRRKASLRYFKDTKYDATLYLEPSVVSFSHLDPLGNWDVNPANKKGKWLAKEYKDAYQVADVYGKAWNTNQAEVDVVEPARCSVALKTLNACPRFNEWALAYITSKPLPNDSADQKAVYDGLWEKAELIYNDEHEAAEAAIIAKAEADGVEPPEPKEAPPMLQAFFVKEVRKQFKGLARLVEATDDDKKRQKEAGQKVDAYRKNSNHLHFKHKCTFKPKAKEEKKEEKKDDKGKGKEAASSSRKKRAAPEAGEAENNEPSAASSSSAAVVKKPALSKYEVMAARDKMQVNPLNVWSAQPKKVGDVTKLAWVKTNELTPDPTPSEIAKGTAVYRTVIKDGDVAGIDYGISFKFFTKHSWAGVDALIKSMTLKVQKENIAEEYREKDSNAPPTEEPTDAYVPPVFTCDGTEDWDMTPEDDSAAAEVAAAVDKGAIMA
jgi:hypothetical protein